MYSFALNLKAAGVAPNFATSSTSATPAWVYLAYLALLLVALAAAYRIVRRYLKQRQSAVL